MKFEKSAKRNATFSRYKYLKIVCEIRYRK